jgi:hypothetical protein
MTFFFSLSSTIGLNTNSSPGNGYGRSFIGAPSDTISSGVCKATPLQLQKKLPVNKLDFTMDWEEKED